MHDTSGVVFVLDGNSGVVWSIQCSKHIKWWERVLFWRWILLTLRLANSNLKWKLKFIWSFIYGFHSFQSNFCSECHHLLCCQDVEARPEDIFLYMVGCGSTSAGVKFCFTNSCYWYPSSYGSGVWLLLGGIIFTRWDHLNILQCQRTEEFAPHSTVNLGHLLFLPVPRIPSTKNANTLLDQMRMWKNGKKLGVPFAWNTLIVLSCWDAHLLARVAVPTFATQATATQTASRSSALLPMNSKKLHPQANFDHKQSLYVLSVEGKSVVGLLLSLHVSSWILKQGAVLMRPVILVGLTYNSGIIQGESTRKTGHHRLTLLACKSGWGCSVKQKWEMRSVYTYHNSRTLQKTFQYYVLTGFWMALWFLSRFRQMNLHLRPLLCGDHILLSPERYKQIRSRGKELSSPLFFWIFLSDTPSKSFWVVGVRELNICNLILYWAITYGK